MKKLIIILTVITALCMYGCGSQPTEPAYNNTEPEVKTGITESDVPSEPVDNQSEPVGENNATSAPVGNKNEANSDKNSVEIISHLEAQPDYEYQLAQSEDVILGEVIEELDGYYCNPDNEREDLMNMWITPYVVRVDESYRDVYSKGDEVIVVAWNWFKPGEEHPDIIIEDESDFYLHEGQRAVFMLNDCSEYLSINGWDKVYELVYQDEGLFEPKETGTANMGEEAKEIFASPCFEITLDQIRGDIKKAYDRYGDSLNQKYDI